jgi:hypothetical protein
MDIQIHKHATHRNGISGAPFDILLFQCPDGDNMLAIVFDERHHVAVLDLDKLARGNIAFMSNSWRGDVFEPHLRQALARLQNARESGDNDGQEVQHG